jgi:tetratricopeptide (TPR) repeat protein
MVICLALYPNLMRGQSMSQSPGEEEAQLHYKVAQIALKNKDLNGALEELRKAAELAPRNSLVQYDLAVVLKQQGVAQEGLDHLQLAIKLGLPIKEKAAAKNLLAELTYALKSQPLNDFVGTWTLEQTNKANCGNSSVTTKFRMVVPPQVAQGGTLKGDYVVSTIGSTSSDCTFAASGTTILNLQIQYKAVLSQVGGNIKMEMQDGRCSGDCAGAGTLGRSFILSKVSADEVKLTDSSGEFLFVSETPTAEYLARKKADADASVGRALSGYVGRWRYVKEGDEYHRSGVFTALSDGKTHHGSDAGVHSSYIWDLDLQLNGNSLTGTLTKTDRETLIQSPRHVLFDSFTYNHRQVTSAGLQVSYEVSGAIGADGGMVVSARANGCSGDCDNPDSYSFKPGTLQLKSSSQLEWRTEEFTKVLQKQ